MDVQIKSDGQLYPPRPIDKPKPPKPKPESSCPPKPPDPPCPPKPQELPLEDLLLIGVALLVLRNSERDLPLILALAYILFDRQFDIKKLF